MDVVTGGSPTNSNKNTLQLNINHLLLFFLMTC
jgi:hypothetical protein